MEIDCREDLSSVGYILPGGKRADGGAAGEDKGRGSKEEGQVEWENKGGERCRIIGEIE